MAPMVALILADGDAPTRARLDTAWPDWADGIDLVIAADGGARHAADLGVAIDLWVGDGDSLGEAGLTALGRDRRADRAVPPGQGRDRTPSSRSGPPCARGADRLVIVGALGGPRVDHALANVGLLALAELAGRPAVILEAAVADLARPRHRRARRAPVARIALGGAPGDTRLAAAAGRRRRGRHHATAWRSRCPTSRSPSGPRAGVSNVVGRRGATVAVRRGLLLVIESPATL